MRNKNASFAGILFVLVVFGASLAGAFVEPSFAQSKKDEGKDDKNAASQTVSPEVGKALQEAYDLIQKEQPKDALATINKLIASRADKMKPYEKSTTYQMRASVKISLEDYRGALSDFQAALDAQGFTTDQNNQLRYYIAQLHFQLGEYQQAIAGLKQWISQATAAGEKVDCSAYYLLAAAYTQITPANFRAALQPAEQSVACLTEPKKGNYDLLNSVYSEVGENTKRAALLEKMINYWPAQKEYWTQLSGLYSTTGKDSDAFSVLEVAYRAGLLSKENEIITLVQYYSFFDNPYRGAKVLEREMNAGVVKDDVKNLTLLSQLWSQAREHKRAIPVLEKASKLSDKGELSYRLGQVLLADEQYAKSEKALQQALKKGGLSERDTGDTWLLLGTAIFSQAGPEDRAVRKRAREAFVHATKYKDSARQARQWVVYLDAIADTEAKQDILECQQQSEARADQIQRLTTKAQVCRLQGGTSECDDMLAQAKQLEAIQNKTNCQKPSQDSTPVPTDTSAQDNGSTDDSEDDTSSDQKEQPQGQKPQ